MPEARQIIFFSHHKCASTWLAHYLQHLAAANGLRYGSTHLSEVMPEGDVILLQNASYPFVRQNKLTGCHVIRNPLSVLNSAYFSHLRTHSTENWPELAGQRALLESADQRTGIFLTMAFIERADFFKGAIGPFHGIRQWDYDEAAYLTLKMEELVQHPAQIFRKAMAFNGRDEIHLPDEDNFRFPKISAGRQPGEIDETSHYRAGHPDDWRANLPQAAIAYVKAHFRPILERFYPEILTA